MNFAFRLALGYLTVRFPVTVAGGRRCLWREAIMSPAWCLFPTERGPPSCSTGLRGAPQSSPLVLTSPHTPCLPLLLSANALSLLLSEQNLQAPLSRHLPRAYRLPCIDQPTTTRHRYPVSLWRSSEQQRRS